MAKSKRQAGSSTGAEITPNNRETREAAQRRQQQRREMFRWLGAGIVLAFVAVLIFIFVANKDDGEGVVAGGPESVETVVPGPMIPSSVNVDGTILGQTTAPILVIQYGDYQCPKCTRFSREEMPKLIQDYVDTGKIRFQFSEFPIVGATDEGIFDQEGESFRAAEAALCANDQGAYWTYHDLLYANAVGEFTGSFTPDRLKEIARQAPGLDLVAFDECVDNRSHAQSVLDLGNAALAAGVTEAPTFIVNGQPVVGADYDELAKVIDAQISGP